MEKKEWDVVLEPNFEIWLLMQEPGIREAIVLQSKRLRVHGPILGRPEVDSIRDSKIPNLKELRIQYKGVPWRVLFVFDPKQQAVLLFGGNKQSDNRWYVKAISVAENRYRQHLKDLEKKYGNKS